MIIKLAWLQELRGNLGRPIAGDKSCFQVRSNGKQILMKNPGGPRAAKGKQQIYRLQMSYWRLHWNFLTPAEQEYYNLLGDQERLSGYDYFMRLKRIPGTLYLHPTSNRWAEAWRPDHHPTAEETLHISDDVNYEDRIYVDFPLEAISSNLVISQAELYFFYQDEAGWDAHGRDVQCRRILEKWSETSITWNNRPNVYASATDTVTMPEQMHWLNFDVTYDINDLINTGIPFYGWEIKFPSLVSTNESSSGWRSTYPHDNDYWPYLKISF